MNRPLGVVVVGTALAVLAAAPPADAAWSVGGEVVSAPLDTARVEARLDRRSPSGVATTEGTSSSTPSLVLAAGSTALLDVVNRSTVAAPLQITVAVDSVVNLGGDVAVCSVPWTVTSGPLGSTATTCSGAQSIIGGPAVVVIGSSSRTWTTPSLQPNDRVNLRIGSGVALLSGTTVTAVPRPMSRDRSGG